MHLDLAGLVDFHASSAISGRVAVNDVKLGALPRPSAPSEKRTKCRQASNDDAQTYFDAGIV